MVTWTTCLLVHVTSRPKTNFSPRAFRSAQQTTPILPHHCLLQQSHSLHLSVPICIIAFKLPHENLSMPFKHCTSQTLSVRLLSLSRCLSSLFRRRPVHPVSRTTSPDQEAFSLLQQGVNMKLVTLWFVRSSNGRKIK